MGSICQETGQEAQGRGWKREAGDDAHGERHGPELRRAEHAPHRGTRDRHLHGLAQLQQPM